MTFFNILPRDKNYLDDNKIGVPLKVIQSNGVSVEPSFKVGVTDLNKGYKNFVVNADNGVKVKVKVIILKDETFKLISNSYYKNTREFLNYIYINAIPVYINTDALDVPTDTLYLLTNNPSRDQTHKTDSVWDLEFTTYAPLNLARYANNNVAVQNAIKKANTKKASVKYAALKKCGYKKLKYSKKKKVVACVKTLQTVLKKLKCYSGKIDGWYGKSTVKAVKKYQKRYNKNHTVTTVQSNTSSLIKVSAGKVITNTNSDNISLPAGTTLNNVASKSTKKTKKITKKLPTNGKVDKATWKALYNGEV